MVYEKADFEHILKATGKRLLKNKRSKFEEQLENAAIDFLQCCCSDRKDPPHKIVKKLNAISKTAKKLSQLIGTSYDLRTRLNFAALLFKAAKPCDVPGIIQAAITSVETLALYADAAHADALRKLKPNTDRKRNNGRVSRQRFVNNLAGVWCEAFGELPGSSVNPHTLEAGGPFIRFLVACHTPLCRTLTELPKLGVEAARAHYRRTAEARLKRYLKQDHGKIKSGKKLI